MTTPGGPIDLELNLNSAGYSAGAQQAVAASGQLETAVGGVIKQQTMLHRIMGVVTPFRTAAAALTGGVAAAAAQEARLSGLAAQQAVTGQSAKSLTAEMNGLARSFPLGQRGAEQLVQSIQHAGVTGAGTEKQVGSLSRQFAQLGSATGESADQLAGSMIKFQRSFGNVRLDTHTIDATNDSLTKLSRTTGASATGILSFASTISPLTRQAGIGQKATLGIAAAFSKLGEDGFAGVNAISKVMTDLNSAARDGGEQMNTYASIVGKTREEFEALVKSDPTKALSDVTKALASPGAAGQRNLERIGLDGVRTQRILTGLSQQGGLESTVNAALSADKGTTKEAADAAEKTLHASAERAAAASEQLAVALGKPLLPLTKFTTDLGGAIASLSTKALTSSTGIPGVDTGIGGLGLGTAAAGAAGLYGLAKVGSVLGTGRTLGTSQIARAGFAGYAKGRGAKRGFAAEFGEQILDAQENDYLGYQVRDAKDDEDHDFVTGKGRRGKYVLDAKGERKSNTAGRAASKISGFFEGIGSAAGPKDESADPVTFGQRIDSMRRGGSFYGSNMLEAAGGLQSDLVSQGRERTSTFRSSKTTPDDGSKAQGMFRGVSAAFREAYARPRDEDGEAQGSKTASVLKGADPSKLKDALKGAGDAVTNWRVDLEKTQGSAGNLRRGLMGLTSTLRETAISGAGLARTFGTMSVRMAASPIGSAAMGIGRSLINPTTIAIGAATLGYERFKGVESARKNEDERLSNMGVSQNLDDYRESLGHAAESTHTLGDNMQAAARMVSSSAQTFAQALDIRPQDRTAAENTRDKVVRHYGDSAAGTIATVNAMAPNGMAPDELNAIKVDLLRQSKSDSYINQVLKGVQTDPARETRQSRLEGTVAPQTAADLARAIAPERTDGYGLTKNEADEWHDKGAWDRLKSVPGIAGTVLGRTFSQGELSRPGGKLNAAEVTKEQQTSIDAAAQGLGQSQESRSQLFGGDFAFQQTYRDANSIAGAVAKRGDANALQKTAQALAKTMGVQGKVDITADDLKKHGGLTQALAAENKDFGEVYAGQQARGVDIAGKGLTGKEQLGIVGATARKYGGSLSGAFDNRLEGSKAPGNREVAASVNAPQDTKAFRAAVDALVDGAVKSGSSLTEVASSAYKLSDQLDSTTQEYAIVKAAREEAQFRQQSAAPFQSTAENFKARVRQNTEIIKTAPHTKEGDADREAAKRDQSAALADYAGMMKSRLLAARDYAKNLSRSNDDFALQQKQQLADYNESVGRSDEDFHTGRLRSQAAFNLQLSRSVADYHKSVTRSEQDFALSMKRLGQDSAKNLLDPFTRLQTQPVWDTGTLVANMREQLEVVDKQLANLDLARSRGLSQATIDMLGLADPKNAQQLNRVIEDTAGDPGAVQDLNRATKSRTRSTSELQGESVDVRRQREDFARGQTRGAADFRQSLSRSRADFNLSTSQQVADFNKQMARAAADQKKMLGRQNVAYDLSLSRMSTDFKDSQMEFAASFEELQKATTDAMAGKNVAWGKLMVDGMKDTTSAMTLVVNDFRGQFDGLLGDVTSLPTAKPKFGSARNEGNGGNNGQGGPSAADEGLAVLPVGGAKATSGFGPRSSPGGIGSTNHAGQDWAVPIGTAVHAFMDGVVTRAGKAGGYGNLMEISHGGGRTTRYAHLSQFDAQPGDRVAHGEVVARSGNTGNSTGAHLHFETRTNGVASNPLTTMPKWAGHPMPISATASSTLTAADLPDDVMNAVRLLGITPEQFIEHLAGADAPTKGAPTNVAGNAKLGKELAEKFHKGWGSGGQWNALYQLFQHESGWNNNAQNATSTAYGIPQFLNSTWAGVGARKTSDPGDQIEAGLKYVSQRYGDPAKAWNTWQARSPHWYGNGGIFTGAQDLGDGRGVGERGPEAVIPLNSSGVSVLAGAMSKFIGDAEARMMSTSSARTHIVHNVENHEYDQRVIVEQATVISQDPNDMGRKLEAKARLSNLTAPPTRR